MKMIRTVLLPGSVIMAYFSIFAINRNKLFNFFMKQLKFKLEDGTFLTAMVNETGNFLEFLYDSGEGERAFRLHKLQVQALLKMINEPMKIGVEWKRGA